MVNKKYTFHNVAQVLEKFQSLIIFLQYLVDFFQKCCNIYSEHL